jgi:hypothetical protein
VAAEPSLPYRPFVSTLQVVKMLRLQG